MVVDIMIESQETRSERQKKTIHRIHRIQGQLTALERQIDADHTCEDLVIQARAIEKATASLITHMVQGYLQHQAKETMRQDPEQAVAEIGRVFQLINQ